MAKEVENYVAKEVATEVAAAVVVPGARRFGNVGGEIHFMSGGWKVGLNGGWDTRQDQEHHILAAEHIHGFRNPPNTTRT